MKVEITGKGPTLLYLHDWAFSGAAWAKQVEYFRARYRNVVPDYNLDACPPNLKHQDLLDHLCGTLIDRLDPQDHASRAIVAHGFGAFLAYELLERGMIPDTLILLGGLVRFTNAEGYLSGLPQERVASMRTALQTDAREMLRRYLQFALSGADEDVSPSEELAIPYPATEYLRLAFDTLISHDYTDVVPRLPVRTLILHGEHDKVSPLWQGELLRKLFKRSEFHICRGAGHVPFLTQFAAVNRRIEQFLEQAT